LAAGYPAFEGLGAFLDSHVYFLPARKFINHYSPRCFSVPDNPLCPLAVQHNAVTAPHLQSFQLFFFQVYGLSQPYHHANRARKGKRKKTFF